MEPRSISVESPQARQSGKRYEEVYRLPQPKNAPRRAKSKLPQLHQ
jgi:hypothetical protein